MVPLALFFALGLREIFASQWAKVLAIASTVALIPILVLAVLTTSVGLIPVLILTGIVIFFAIERWLRLASETTPLTLVHVGLLALDIVCLWGFIIPYFRMG
jgi:hypothetical protein